jgi:hypothetical protein
MIGPLSWHLAQPIDAAALGNIHSAGSPQKRDNW